MSFDFSVSESDWLPESDPLPESLLPDWLLLLDELELEPEPEPEPEPDPEPDSSSELLSEWNDRVRKRKRLEHLSKRLSLENVTHFTLRIFHEVLRKKRVSTRSH